ncbi:MAG: alpha/beta fold hydrolase, partial [Myxococcales bacterium]
HGAAPPATSWEGALRALEPLLEPGPVVLGGYSMGARIALALALRRPERIARLVLASGTAGIEDEAERARRRADDEGLARFIEERGVPAFVDRWEKNPVLAIETVSPETVSLKRLREERLRNSATGLASALRHLGAGAQPSYWSELHRLEVPVVLLAGTRDTKFTALATRLQRLLPRAELRPLAGCGHLIHLERPEDFEGALR